jgi:hypothetical protein
MDTLPQATWPRAILVVPTRPGSLYGRIRHRTETPDEEEGAAMEDERLEGWCTDPFGRHEARWLSDGTPTKLVRDGEAESYDDPPDEEPSQVPEPIVEDVPADGGRDLLRAGEPDSAPSDLESLERQMSEAALEGGAHPEVDLGRAPPPT